MEKKEIKEKLNNLFAVEDVVSKDELLANKVLKILEAELDKAREEGYEKDIASDFLYWHPLGGGMPNSSIRIGVEFEVGGCHEDWGFVIEQNGKTISSGRTLKEAIDKLSGYTVGKRLPKNMKGYLVKLKTKEDGK